MCSADSGNFSPRLPLGVRTDLETLGAVLHQLEPDLLAQSRRECMGLLNAKGEAEDMVQQTLFQAVLHFDQFEGETEAELKSWLSTTLHRIVQNRIRWWKQKQRDSGREKAQPAGEHGDGPLWDPPADDPTPSSQARKREHCRLLDVAMQRLQEPWRTAVRLKYLDGMSHAEVGAALSVTPEAARKYCVHARDSLRSMLAELMGPAGP